MVRSFHVFWKTRTIHHHPEYRMDTEFPLVREAHNLPRATLRKRNDEILDRIYIGRRFKNDTDRKCVPTGKSAGKTLGAVY